MIHLRELFSEQIGKVLDEVSGTKLSSYPMRWKAYFPVVGPEDESGDLFGAVGGYSEKHYGSFVSSLIMLRTACAQDMLNPPLNDRNCHAMVHFKYEDNNRTIYELINGQVRTPWFYCPFRHRQLIVSHSFLKKTQKAPTAEQNHAIALYKDYSRDMRAHPKPQVTFHADKKK
ncbi:hypothetical protein [Cupriavidus pauculus]|uniref:hypothetical protein n=1 Tax=Cupriavidus pauculus TaxID=82633 RepID=UPI001EE22989|nr:hypothetical protein [Cupriavidus pauculus]GJG96804.1 hypothetical protein CBA19C6_19965 [Cupriavidus pauculus]